MKDIEFGKRVVRLREIKEMTQEDAAQKIGIKYRTYQTHEAGQWPNRERQKKYLDYYKCDETWFKTGKGEPYPEGDGRKGTIYIDKGGTGGGEVHSIPAPEYRASARGPISDILIMAARILESGTSYATALILNIQHFDRAIQAETRIVRLEKEYEELKERLAALEEDQKATAIGG